MGYLHFDLSHDGQLLRRDLTHALPTEDLCLKAARLLQKVSGTPHGALIQIEKRVPAQAGMGGV